MKDPIRLRHDPRASEYCRELLEEGSDAPPDFEYDVASGLIRFERVVRLETVRPSGRVRRVPRSRFGRFSIRAPVYALISGFAAVAFGGVNDVMYAEVSAFAYIGGFSLVSIIATIGAMIEKR